MLRPVDWQTVTDVSKDRSAFTFGASSRTTILRNARNYWQTDTTYEAKDQNLQQHRCESLKCREEPS